MWRYTLWYPEVVSICGRRMKYFTSVGTFQWMCRGTMNGQVSSFAWRQKTNHQHWKPADRFQASLMTFGCNCEYPNWMCLLLICWWRGSPRKPSHHMHQNWVKLLQTYLTRDAARQDVFDYIEMFYNPNRKHTNNGMLSPVDYEKNDVSWTKQVSRKLGAPHNYYLTGWPINNTHPKKNTISIGGILSSYFFPMAIQL